MRVRDTGGVWSMKQGSMVEVRPTTYSYVFSPYREPVAHVRPGDRVVIYTNDAFEGRITHAEALPSKALQGAKFFNPQTGPIYVEGVEPGDTLVVQIESIEPTRDFAVSCLIPYFGGLTSTATTRTLQEPLPERVWIWKLHDRKLTNADLGVELDWDPFMGTFAVAPDLQAISALATRPIEGNMNVPDVMPRN